MLFSLGKVPHWVSSGERKEPSFHCRNQSKWKLTLPATEALEGHWQWRDGPRTQQWQQDCSPYSWPELSLALSCCLAPLPWVSWPLPSPQFWGWWPSLPFDSGLLRIRLQKHVSSSASVIPDLVSSAYNQNPWLIQKPSSLLCDLQSSFIPCFKTGPLCMMLVGEPLTETADPGQAPQ